MSVIPQTIGELTNYEYNELYYNSAKKIITGSYISIICDLLSKCGVSVKTTSSYDETLSKAVAKYQTSVKLKSTGILDNTTLQTMLLQSSKMSDAITEDEAEQEESESILSDSPHYNSYFKDDNYKMHRKNHKDIKISFGNNSIVKTIKDVFMRSVTVEVDTSGNPISEVYEFIARDVKESDEITDLDKYISDEDKTSSDIKYDFSSIK